ncbi:MAG: acyltransferase, partial [Planctomycetota bacterium]
GERLGGMDRHLWTLSVEEQFYLVWPLWILLAPRVLVTPGLVVALLLGPAWRAWVMFYLDKPGIWAEWPTPANLDLLAGGGLLAVVWPRVSATWWRVLFLLGVPGVAVACVWSHVDALLPWWKWFATGNRLVIAVCFVGLVGVCAHGIGGPVGKMLTLRPIVYVGMISYGMYLFHVFAAAVVRQVLPDLRPDGWVVGLLAIALTILAAALSWHGFEAPINRLKRKLPYRKTPSPSAPC